MRAREDYNYAFQLTEPATPSHMHDTKLTMLVEKDDSEVLDRRSNDVFNEDEDGIIDSTLGALVDSATAANPTNETISYCQHLIDVSKLTYPIILGEIFQNTLHR